MGSNPDPKAAGGDEWVAAVASYIRTSFGNNGGLVTAADVARVRAETTARKTLWTVPEIESTLPRPLDQQQWKLSASLSAETASNAISLRGWNSGQPQTAGMWFQAELPQPVLVSEIQFDSLGAQGGGGGGRALAPPPGAAAPGAGAAPAGPPAGRGGFGGAPVIGYPRGYSVQTSLDGSTWSQPLATGKGEGSRTTIAVKPTRAKFVRITQTDSPADAPAWSISNLRIYEAPATAGGK